MDHDTLQDCLVEQLRDIYDAEKQLVKALPKLAKACENEDLAEAITEHLQETQEQVERLEQVFEALGAAAKGKPCKGMKGLIEETNEHAEEAEGVARDLAIIAAAQRVEHYEISAYGTARTMAEQLGNTQAAQLLEEIEEEEFAADSRLSEIAMELYEELDEAKSEDDEDIEVEIEETEEAVAPKRPESQGMKVTRGKTAR